MNSGISIAIIGTDGSGKSTIIDAIRPILTDTMQFTVHVRHLRPSFLPPLARFKGRVDSQTLPVTDPHGSATSGVIGSFLRVSYATLNYILGYWFETRRFIVKDAAIVIFDRYAYDMFLDQRRFRINLPSSIVHWFAYMAPKPDLIFCLHGSPEVLAARKLELPVEEVARQVAALENFAENEPRATMIDTEQTVETCRDHILRTIVDYLKNRNE